MIDWHCKSGAPYPRGVCKSDDGTGWNFALYSKHAHQVQLLLFQHGNLETPMHTVMFDYRQNKSGPVWHCRVPDSIVSQADFYAYRVSGPEETNGFHTNFFDSEKLLLDPYARSVYFPDQFDRAAACTTRDNSGQAPLGILPHLQCSFDWLDDAPVRHGSDLIIYELHVRGFTARENSGVAPDRRGTFLGVIDKIPYLQELGITAVELMPVFQFDPGDGNYWGYMPLNFFAPHHEYAQKSNHCEQRFEFQQMVGALHRADIEVILDVVFNHTCEGNQDGPCYCFKGIDASTYYVLTGDSEMPFANYSGTGNTLHTANRAVRRLIVDSMRYWVKEMHVDGFRFDLASIFTRSSDGSINRSDPPIFGQISADPDLEGIRLIAEPWDLDAYQLGKRFPGDQWFQWNGAFRDTIQRFVRGDSGMVPDLMTRVYGSSDLFPDDRMHALRPFQSINYVTSHDGFTMRDLISYNHRHNEENGHGNRDGHNDFSWNCGCEGDEDAPDVVTQLRKQQVKNMFAILMLSAGTPMIRMGDEFFQTQLGNNNPYNQDNEVSWLDWDNLGSFVDLHRFVREIIAFRKRHALFGSACFWHDNIQWFGVNGLPDLSADSRCLAYYLRGSQDCERALYVMLNATEKEQHFGVLASPSAHWRRVIDTSLESPGDIVLWQHAQPLMENAYSVGPHSVVVMEAD